MDFKELVICSTQRSGSTLVYTDIASTGVMGTAQELVNFLRQDNKKPTGEELTSYLKSGVSENGFYLLKIMSNEIRYLASLLGDNDANASHAIASDLFPNCLWLYVVRRDILSQAASRYLSRKTEIYHSTADNKKVRQMLGPTAVHSG